MPIIVSFCENFIFKALAATCGAVVISLVGTNYLAYEILFILIIVDTITGVSVAFHKKEFSSSQSFKGLKKIFLFFGLVIASHQITRYSGSFDFIEHGVVLYCAANELLSIIENSGELGLPLPSWIVDRLKIFKETGHITKTE